MHSDIPSYSADAGSTAPQASIAATERLEEWNSGDEEEVGGVSYSHPESIEATPAIVSGHHRSARLAQPTPDELDKYIVLNGALEDDQLPPTQPEVHLQSPPPVHSSKDFESMRDWKVKCHGMI